MKTLKELNVKLFADGADRAEMVEMYSKPLPSSSVKESRNDDVLEAAPRGSERAEIGRDLGDKLVRPHSR